MILIIAGGRILEWSRAGPSQVGRRPPRVIAVPDLQLVLVLGVGSSGPLPRGQGVLLTVREQPLFDRGHHLLGAGEEDEDEETLESVEDEEDIPDIVIVQDTSDKSSDPGETHQDEQSDIEEEVCLWTRCCDLCCGS